MAQGKSGWLLPLGLLAACAGLGWFIYQELQVTPRSSRPTGGKVEASVPELQTGVASFVMKPVENFAAIVERPIFSPTRRPPAEGSVTIEAAEPELKITLNGVVISGEEQIAIIAPSSGTKVLRLREGDLFQGWTLELIEPDRVTFRRGEIEERIELSYDRPPPPKKTERQRARDKKKQERQEKKNAQ